MNEPSPKVDLPVAVLDAYRRETRFARLLGAPVPVTRTLLAGIGLAALAMVLLAEGLGSAMEEPFPYGATLAFGWKSNAAIEAGQSWRILTSMYLHANLLHLAVNAFALAVLGPLVERLYGSGRFFLLYTVAGIVGGVASYLFTEAPAVGASGAIFGLLGAAVVFGPRFRRELPPAFARRLVVSLLPWVLLNIVIGLVVPRIDNAAHMGGLVAGAFLGLLLGSRLRPASRVRQRLLHGALGFAVAATLLAAALMVAEVRRCGADAQAFESCYRAELEAAEVPVASDGDLE